MKLFDPVVEFAKECSLMESISRQEVFRKKPEKLKIIYRGQCHFLQFNERSLKS